MIVVSGCPRSGTSMMMDMMQTALGQERIVGSKWMNLERHAADPHTAACYQYIKNKVSPEWDAEVKKTKAMNPNGFWESVWTTAGIQYTTDAPPADSVAKIVSQGLARSNPAYIHRVVFMIRHPWAVAKSQNDLRVLAPQAIRRRAIGGSDPTMFCEVTTAAARWMLQHKPQTLMVNYDEMTKEPAPAIDAIRAFVGPGNWKAAEAIIDTSLKRSKPERAENGNAWELSIDIYEMLKAGDWSGIVQRYEQHQDEQPPRASFLCTRWGGRVNDTICRSCRTRDDTVRNMKTTAERRGVDWIAEPCLWESGMNPAKETYTPITIEQSIANNHWLDHPRGLGDTIEAAAARRGIKACTGCKWRKALANWLFRYRRQEDSSSKRRQGEAEQ